MLPIRAAIEQLKDKPCADCGHKFNSWQMDFDHLEGYEKKFAVSRGVNAGYSLETILAEIAKCDLVCANCHRNRTHLRRCVSLDESDCNPD